MTQLENARNKIITKEIKDVAKAENIARKTLCSDIAKGQTVILKSKLHQCKAVGVGKNLTIKVNANIGTSNMNSDLTHELKKLYASIRYGAHTVMDLSTGGDISKIRRKIIKESTIPVGTVPIYQTITREPDVSKLREKDFLDSIKEHINDGVDFITVHCGITKEAIPLLKSRVLGVVSRGGSFLIKWMLYHKKENPLYTYFSKILDMAKEYDVVLSLGDGLRPGCIADATDHAQIDELKKLGHLAKNAQKKGIQVMIEGPGHVPLHQIKQNIRLEKKYCHKAPFYVLGPLVTDISPGYDHITGAIGGALAAYYGADFLCYLTPREHLGLPDIDDVIDGVIASRIAAHAADIARGINNAHLRDKNISHARSNLDWKEIYHFAINPDKAKELRNSNITNNETVCTMCGDFCSVKINKECKENNNFEL